MADALFAIAMLAAFVLAGGGTHLLATGRARKQGALMLVMAAVLVFNVLIWSLPPPAAG